MSHSTFERIPGDVLHKVAVLLSELSFLGPPNDILSMLLLSKEVYQKVAWRHVYAEIFTQKFDISTPVRRLGNECGVVSALAAELIRRFKTLRRLKDDAYLDLDDAETLRLDLWTAYLMFLENQGKNAKQLVSYARVDTFALNYISPGGPLHEGADDNYGLTVDSESNTLAISLFWFTDNDRVKSETPSQRRAVLDAFFWLFVGSLMYPSTTFPLTTFRVPASNALMPLIPHSADSSLRWSPGPSCTIPDHFGFKLNLTRPLISSPAYLSTAVRSEAIDAKDLRSIEAALVDWDDEATGTSAGAKSYDADWARLHACYELRSQPAKRVHAVFKPGSLHGKWVGRWAFPHYDNQGILLGQLAGQPIPMQLHIREHHQTCKDGVLGYDDISHDGIGRGLLNSWLPKNATMKAVGNDLLVYDPNTKQSSTYRTYDPHVAAGDDADENIFSQEDRGLYGSNIHDILLTAQTDETFGQRWGHYRFEGRVRDCDGLVMLVRRSASKKRRWIFYGQVHGGRNIVGRWRDTTTPITSAGWSGVWCMTKEGE